jgi:RNA polymerase sigma-70 factor (ECF subfamily)
MLTAKTQSELGADDDLVLVHAAKQGHLAAFEQLVERYTTMIFRVSVHIMNSPEDAEEIVRDACLKDFQHLHNFEERGRFSTWLTRIAVNEALIRLRRSRRVPSVSMDDHTDESRPLVERIADWRPDPGQLYGKAQFKEILQQALVSLPDTFRVVFVLRDVEGLSSAETAEMLQLSIPTIKTRLFRARLELRQRLSPYFERKGSAIQSSLRRKRILGILNEAGKLLDRQTMWMGVAARAR